MIKVLVAVLGLFAFFGISALLRYINRKINIKYGFDPDDDLPSEGL